MKIGDMRHRILFLTPGETEKTDLGEYSPLWIPLDPGGGRVLNPPFKLANDQVGVCVSIPADIMRSTLKKYGVWANIAPTTGREYQEAQKIRAETTYKVKLRYFPGITSELRILYRNSVYTIESVLELNHAKREVHLICAEVDTYGKETG